MINMEQTIKKIPLIFAISLLLVSIGFLFKNPGITGHVAADFRSQTFNLELDNSQSFLLKTNSQNPIYISSFRLSGNIIGEGSVEIFIENNGRQVLIYKNVVEKEQGMPAVTGMAVAPGDMPEVKNTPSNKSEEGISIIMEPLEKLEWTEGFSLSDKQKFFTGAFNDKCVDTCFIEMPLSSEKTYRLIFMIQPGTKLEINKITYTLKSGTI